MRRALLALVLLVLGIAAVRAMPGAQQIIIFGGNNSASGGGGATNFILLVDGSSKLLQIDNASRVCRAGGC